MSVFEVLDIHIQALAIQFIFFSRNLLRAGFIEIDWQEATRGLLATGLVILSHGQVTRRTPDLATPSPNFHKTPAVGSGGVKNNIKYRIAIVEQNKSNVQLPGPGRPSVSLLQLTGRHFPEHILPTEKKSTPTRQCFICHRKTDEKGKRIRRKT
ncbi:hypothetical protein TNCV_3692081 [Trichonephila clavipes]|nr:hypothetical protein TNCV_3692081 [Trichonephila clavipes]